MFYKIKKCVVYFLKEDAGDRETQVKFLPREAPLIIEVMKCIMGLNPEYYKNVAPPQWTAEKYLARGNFDVSSLPEFIQSYFLTQVAVPLTFPQAEIEEVVVEEELSENP